MTIRIFIKTPDNEDKIIIFNQSGYFLSDIIKYIYNQEKKIIYKNKYKWKIRIVDNTETYIVITKLEELIHLM